MTDDQQYLLAYNPKQASAAYGVNLYIDEGDDKEQSIQFIATISYCGMMDETMSRPEKSSKIKENLWIAYRYKIIIDEVPNQGSSIFPILKYRDANAILDIVRIQTENEAFKIED